MITIRDTENGRFIVERVDEDGTKVYCYDTANEVAEFVLNYYGGDLPF